jgi:hypothetical protein
MAKIERHHVANGSDIALRPDAPNRIARLWSDNSAASRFGFAGE